MTDHFRALTHRDGSQPRERAARPTWPLKIEAAYGRLYVSGTASQTVRRLPGATWNEARQSFELSLTLETLRAIKAAYGFTSSKMMQFCSPQVMQWANAAHASEQRVSAVHERIASGWRVQLPWRDMRAGTPAPLHAPDAQTEEAPNGTRVWRYRAPFEHQLVMATVACSLDGAAYLCEVGTSKTRPALESAAYHVRNRTIDIAIAIIPANLFQTWEKETRTWTPDLRAVALRDTIAERRKYLKRIAQNRMRGQVILINYEVLARMRNEIVELCKTMRVGIIADEMHRVRNPSAGMTKAIMEIAPRAPWRLGLTGSPILNGAQNIWSQWYFVDLGITFGANFVQFRREHFSENPYTYSIDPLHGTGTLSDIGQRLRRRGVRYRKEDCLDLPPQIYETLHIEMTAEQRRAYNQMADTLVARLQEMEDERTATASIQLTMMLRLAQITSGFLPAEDDDTGERVRHTFSPNPKLNAMVELAEELRAQNQKFIVWAIYRNDIETIVQALRRQGFRVAAYYGGSTRRERDAAERAMQDGELDALIGHPASGGVGLTLTEASTVVYYSQSFNLEHRIQSEGRTHRPGAEQHERITYIDLVCRNSIDEMIQTRLSEKLSDAETVTEMVRTLREAA